MPFAELADDDRCPCLSGETYSQCCGPFHRGAANAPTAERLMRSRYSAYVVGDAAYLLQSWHPRTRPAELDLDPDLRWYRLDVLATNRGGLLDDVGTVEFRAYHRSASGRGDQHEVSRFVREGRAWRYLDAT
jgi:SEC-C motif domain protein